MARPHLAGSKLRFTVAHVSGEDEDYPARELHFHTPQTRGWQCARFSKFPQELVLRLDHPARIHQIQILSHEYKIATKVELYTGLLPPGESSLDRAVMRRLGHLSFDSNLSSGHQARELKSVHVNVDAAVLRLVIHKCHVNKLNIYNQVGVVALNVIGEPITPDGGGAGYMAQQADPHGRPRHAGLADVALDLDVDPVTAMKIREIYALKEAAVAREDYDEAKRLKDGINRLKAVGAKVAQLEAKKSSAIEAEDYDAAKLIKVEIDKLREAGGVTALGESVGVRGSYRERENEPADQIFNRALDAHGANPMSPPKQPQQPAPVMEFTDHGPDAAADAYEDDDRYEDPTQTSAPMPDPGPPGPPQNDYYDAGGLSPAQLKQLRATAGPDDVPPAASNTYGGRDYDERPAVSKAAAAQMQGDGGLPTPTRFRDNDPSALGANNDEVPALATGRGGNQFSEDEMMGGGGGGGGGGNADAPPKPPGFGGGDDLPAPDPIPPSMEGDARPIVEAFGEYCAMCLYSKNWMHREAALADMEKKVSSGDVKGDQREIFRVLCQHFGRLFKDKVANVFAATCKLLTSATRKMGPSLGPREVHSEVSPLVVLLLERLGDAHVKVRDAAHASVMDLAGSEMSLVAKPLTKPVRSQSVWRVVLGRLTIMHALIPRHGLAKDSNQGLSLESVMEFTAKAFESPNGDVRSAAVKVTLECCAIAGRAVEKFLPKNLKPAIREIIDEGLGGAAPAPAAAAKKPAAAARKPAPPPKATTPTRPAPAASHGAPNARELKAEIAAREKEVGKTHPDVAVALTDLAALHSEEERFAEAQPLYERALRIQEKALGKDHQDTVQTLTDLAICHLDQGHNGVGRPLLERALVLQQKALGPNHADVTAIRDVLQSLDADEGM